MLETEMALTSRAVVEECLNITEGEEVAVITDARKMDVARSIATATNACGANAVTITMPLLDSHGNEPLDLVANALATADVAFTCTTHAITHTKARLRASEAGTRIGILRGVTADMMVDGAMTVDFPQLRERTVALSKILSEAKKAEVTDQNGTDISFSLEGCQAHSLDGYYHEDYGWATLPPGESPTHPAEGTANGTIVIDVSMDNLGKLSEPVELEVTDGFVTSVRGGEEAQILQRVFDEHGRNARNLAEFAIGTNPKAKLIGNLAEDKKLEGTVHFAVGDNQSLGGTIQSDIHLDGVIRSPTVVLDGTVVVDDGELQRDLLKERVADPKPVAEDD